MNSKQKFHQTDNFLDNCNIQLDTEKKQCNQGNNYLKTYVSLITLFFLAIAFTNIIVDPKELINSLNLLNIKKEKFSDKWNNHARTYKANNIKAGNYNSLILGNSRALVGLDPEHPTLAEYSTYNASLPKSNIYEIEKVFNYTRKNQKLTKIIIGLDLGQFSAKANIGGDFNRSRFAGDMPYFKHYASNVISLPYFFDSLNSVQLHLSENIPKKSEFTIVKGLKKRTETYIENPQKRFIGSAKAFTSNKGYLNFTYDPETIEILNRIIAKCRKEGIEISLFISPIHAWQMQAMEVSGIFPLMEQWKQDLVNLIAEDRQKYPHQAAILLWDFSTYNSITTESVPLTSQDKMQWYTDPSHYKKELGDLILYKVSNFSQDNEQKLQDFGVVINLSNIQSHLAHIRQQQVEYKKSNPQDIEIIEYLAKNNKN